MAYVVDSILMSSVSFLNLQASCEAKVGGML